MRLGAFTDAGCVGVEVVERMIEMGASDRTLTRHAQQVAGALVTAGLAVSAAQAIEDLRRIAGTKDRRAVLEKIRTAIRKNDRCWPLPGEGTEAGGAPGRAPA